MTLTQELTTQAIQQAMVAARSGRLADARTIADQALNRGGEEAPLNAILGMLCARTGELETATIHLQRAMRARPTDVTIACNLIAVLIDQKRIDEAFEVATAGLAAADLSLRIARFRGFLAQSLEQYDEAVAAYQSVVAEAPEDFESWNNLGNALAGLGRFEEAANALRCAVKLDPHSAPTCLNLASALDKAGMGEDSERLLQDTAKLFPDDARPLHELYVRYKIEHRHEEALSVLEEAVRRDPENANLLLKFGVECGLVHRIEDAELAFLKAIEVDPLARDCYLGLAVQYEHTNRESDLRPLADRARAAGLDDGSLAFLDVMAMRREKKYLEALERLSAIDPEVEPVRTSHIRATIYDRLGRHDEAFAALRETNALQEADPSDPLGRAAEMRREVESNLELLSKDWFSRWQGEALRHDDASPVFLVGFPRSGTTLLDTILMGHPKVQVMEEQPPLSLVDLHIGGMDKLPTMTGESIAIAREQYFHEVRKVCDYDHSRVLVDKSPLFMHKAALIHRLFPSARIILALRHPCDVLLSCLMSNFRLNSAMSSFLRLEDAAQLYDISFRLWEKSREVMPLNVHTVVYERMVTGVEEEMRPLFDFLGLDWNAAALDHTKTAAQRGLITTASYAQVVEPIYKSSLGRWEGYRHYLEPTFPVIRPWVEKFGYSLEDPSVFPERGRL